MRLITLIAAASIIAAVATTATAQTGATPPATTPSAGTAPAGAAPAVAGQPTDTVAPRINLDDAIQNKRQHEPCKKSNRDGDCK